MRDDDLTTTLSDTAWTQAESGFETRDGTRLFASSIRTHYFWSPDALVALDR